MADILIVGADQGIGYFMVKQFLEQGDRVAVLDIRTEHIAKLTEQYQERLYVFTADAADDTLTEAGFSARSE